MDKSKQSLFAQARQCTLCADLLPFSPKPIIQGRAGSPVCIISQAPGSNAHSSGIPWNDRSGDRLRSWLGLDEQRFYDPAFLAILPMGFCYPGKGKSGDLPPIKVCAPTWHPALLEVIKPKITILIGKYAQDRYLSDRKNLTERIQQWQKYLPDFICLPHPSPLNNRWLKKNSWFETETLPAIRAYLQTQWLGL